MQDYQGLYRHLEAVEGTIPTVGLVEETEERLNERIALYQVPLFVVNFTLGQQLDDR